MALIIFNLKLQLCAKNSSDILYNNPWYQAGNYSCHPDNLHPARVSLHVLSKDGQHLPVTGQANNIQMERMMWLFVVFMITCYDILCWFSKVVLVLQLLFCETFLLDLVMMFKHIEMPHWAPYDMIMWYLLDMLELWKCHWTWRLLTISSNILEFNERLLFFCNCTVLFISLWKNTIKDF